MATISIKNNHAAAPYSNQRRFYTTIDLFLNTFYALFYINLIYPLHTLYIRLAHPFIIFHTKLCLLSTASQPPPSQRIFVYSPALLTTIAAHILKDMDPLRDTGTMPSARSNRRTGCNVCLGNRNAI